MNTLKTLPNTPAQACELAQKYTDQQIPIVSGECDHYVGFWYGLVATGEYSALNHWEEIKSHAYPDPHAEEAKAAGNLVFYGYAGRQFGHAAMLTGKWLPGQGVRGIYSSDLPRVGRVGIVRIDQPTRSWELPLLGITPPLFPEGVA